MNAVSYRITRQRCSLGFGQITGNLSNTRIYSNNAAQTRKLQKKRKAKPKDFRSLFENLFGLGFLEKNFVEFLLFRKMAEKLAADARNYWTVQPEPGFVIKTKVSSFDCLNFS